MGAAGPLQRELLTVEIALPDLPPPAGLRSATSGNRRALDAEPRPARTSFCDARGARVIYNVAQRMAEFTVIIDGRNAEAIHLATGYAFLWQIAPEAPHLRNLIVRMSDRA